jgi:hypothetical protein
MAAQPFADTAVKVLSAGARGIVLQIGPETFDVDPALLRAIYNGTGRNYGHLLFNIAAGVSLAGIDPTNLAAVKAYIEGRTFKF